MYKTALDALTKYMLVILQQFITETGDLAASYDRDDVMLIYINWHNGHIIHTFAITINALVDISIKAYNKALSHRRVYMYVHTTAPRAHVLAAVRNTFALAINSHMQKLS